MRRLADARALVIAVRNAWLTLSEQLKLIDIDEMVESIVSDQTFLGFMFRAAGFRYFLHKPQSVTADEVLRRST